MQKQFLETKMSAIGTNTIYFYNYLLLVGNLDPDPINPYTCFDLLPTYEVALEVCAVFGQEMNAQILDLEQRREVYGSNPTITANPTALPFNPICTVDLYPRFELVCIMNDYLTNGGLVFPRDSGQNIAKAQALYNANSNSSS